MINTDAFAQRLQKVIDYYSESASSFADSIGVQRSSISHILSGRNKPSLDFVLKILSTYPDIELYWLLNGKGSFPSLDKTEDKKEQTFSSQDLEEKIKALPKKQASGKIIERIVIFYSDGSFENFQNS